MRGWKVGEQAGTVNSWAPLPLWQPWQTNKPFPKKLPHLAVVDACVQGRDLSQNEGGGVMGGNCQLLVVLEPLVAHRLHTLTSQHTGIQSWRPRSKMQCERRFQDMAVHICTWDRARRGSKEKAQAMQKHAYRLLTVAATLKLATPPSCTRTSTGLARMAGTSDTAPGRTMMSPPRASRSLRTHQTIEPRQG